MTIVICNVRKWRKEGVYTLLKKWSEFSLYLSLRPGEWPQWSLLLEWISSEPDEIPLVEKWIFTLLELESSEIHSSTSEISSLHGWSELFTRFFFREYMYCAEMKEILKGKTLGDESHVNHNIM